MKLKNLLLAIALCLPIILSSCSSDKSADARDLLLSIPSDISFVAVANSGSILDKAGIKVDDGNIEAPDALESHLAKIKDVRTRSLMKTIFSGKSGVEPTALAIFREGYNTYLTGFINNTSDFKKCVTDNGGSEFKSENDLEISDNIAMTDHRFWINLDQHTIDAQAVKAYINLAKDQSFMSNPYAENLCKVEKDIEGWGNIAGMLNTANLKFQDRATVQIALETLFEDAAAAAFSVEFTDGSATLKANLLNSKGKDAKYQFPTEKVDINTIASIGGTADMIAALSIPNKMIEQLKKETASKAPSMLGMILTPLSCVDGTLAIAANNDDAMAGVINTNGGNTSDLSALLAQTGVTTEREGNNIRFKKGELKGSFNVATEAKLLKGEIAGVAVANPSGRTNIGVPGLKSATFALMPEKGVTLCITLKSENSKDNFLKAILSE